MGKYIAKRLAYTLAILLLISLGVYLIFSLLPMDPAALDCTRNCSPAVIEANRVRLGLDVPVWQQYLLFLKGIFFGRSYGEGTAIFSCPAPALGYSWPRHECVTSLLLTAFPTTFSLALGAFIIWLVLGIGLGVIAARYKHRLPDRLATGFVLLGTSLPTFISGLLLLVFFVLRFNLVNPLNMGRWVSPWSNPILFVNNFIWAWLTLALAYAALYTRLTRANVLDTASEDFIRTARAKGLSEKVIVRKHTLRAALAPVVTVAGLDFAGLLGGAIITEQIFNLPGLGRLALQAVLVDYDLPLIVGTTLLAGAFIVVMNLVVDILYAFIDPRVRVA